MLEVSVYHWEGDDWTLMVRRLERRRLLGRRAVPLRDDDVAALAAVFARHGIELRRSG